MNVSFSLRNRPFCEINDFSGFTFVLDAYRKYTKFAVWIGIDPPEQVQHI
ncbi:hypothetical protein Deipe_2802 [Deinococcus peraridilitoris DSM 19664]|uniref:Uncharacterized protein n=1 Tax=Deinococcus peraridilitoris (strain DSM 19664 / LMG 22246 / CIP 109416 / KR-200) TaxID=937777 RepID=L0A347_DEIPD|nr:hypothetical protein Deipe_2802 [Deinococcus peraridilitoris DSM 19664]